MTENAKVCSSCGGDEVAQHRGLTIPCPVCRVDIRGVVDAAWKQGRIAELERLAHYCKEQYADSFAGDSETAPCEWEFARGVLIARLAELEADHD